MATDLEKAAIAALIISLMLLLKKKTKEKTLDMGQALVNKMGNWQRKTNNPSNKPDTNTLQTSSSDKVFITWFKKKKSSRNYWNIIVRSSKQKKYFNFKREIWNKKLKKLSTSNILKIDKVAKLCQKYVRFFCLHY